MGAIIEGIGLLEMPSRQRGRSKWEKLISNILTKHGRR